MPVTTERPKATPETIHHSGHERCFVCGSDNHRGLNIAFHKGENGWTEATLEGDESLQGYSRMMHGGIISLLLDAAMTHCLFACGCPGVSAKMEVKFRHPVAVDRSVHVRARLVRSSPPGHELAAELLQDGVVKATCCGLFVDRPQ